MALGAVWDGGPGTCHFAITSACNARCAFCSFARDRLAPDARHFVTLADAKLACDILKRNGIRFVHFTGGEPLVHRDFTAMVAYAAQAGIIPTLITNGALLTTTRVDALAQAGPWLGLYLDRRSLALRARPARFERSYTPSQHRTEATSNPEQRLRHDESVVDYRALPELLRELGFNAVTFSYPLRTLPSSYLACADSSLVDFTPEELHAAFEAVKVLRGEFPVLSPVASIEHIQRHLRGEPERVPRWVEVFLRGLESPVVVLPQLGPAALRHPGFRRNSAHTRRMHRVHD